MHPSDLPREEEIPTRGMKRSVTLNLAEQEAEESDDFAGRKIVGRLGFSASSPLNPPGLGTVAYIYWRQQRGVFFFFLACGEG